MKSHFCIPDFSSDFSHKVIKKWRNSVCLTALFVIVGISFPTAHGANQAHGLPVHPRCLIDASDIVLLREKVIHHPYREVFELLHKNTALASAQTADIAGDAVALSQLALKQSYMFLITGTDYWAKQAFYTIQLLDAQTTVFRDINFRGLDKATVLRELSFVYDFCFNGWNSAQREYVNQKLWDLMVSVAANMGHEANYSLVSNWMGIRYASVMLAAIVWDDLSRQEDGNKQQTKASNPFLWDTVKRLKDHIDLNVNQDGWNGESMNYFNYNWSFIAPALIALQKHHQGQHFDLKTYVPNTLHAMWARSAISVSIPNHYSLGLQTDFSVDDLRAPSLLYPLSFALFPEDQKPYLRWMNQYLFDPANYVYPDEQLFYFLLWDDETIIAENPELAGWRNYIDHEQGLVVFRNGYRDQHDIVAAFTTTGKRVRGHQAFDNLGFRIMGLGSAWAIGAGRTDLVAGQTSLFPAGDISQMKGTQHVTGTLDMHAFGADGSGYAVGSGSCMGVDGHTRRFVADYSQQSGAEAVFVVDDTSDNGRIWRMNTPEFNEIILLEDGFLLTAPNKSSLKASVYSGGTKIQLSHANIRYGGNTVRLNPGICFNGNCYDYSSAIDVLCDGDITVVMTLQPEGKPHPHVAFDKENRVIIVGGVEMQW